MGNKINININNLFSINMTSGITVYDVAKEYKKVTDKSIIGCKIKNKMVDFDTIIYEDTDIFFFDHTTLEGNKMYQAGLKFLLCIAVQELWNKTIRFEFSLDKGICATIDKKLSNLDIFEIKNKMQELVNYDLPIKKRITCREDAINYFNSVDETEKVFNIVNTTDEYVELYEIDHKYNNYYDCLPNSTGELKQFDIIKISSNSIVLIYPEINSKKGVPQFNFNDKVYDEIINYKKWSQKLNIDYASSINQKIINSEIKNFIFKSDIYMNEKFSQIAKNIIKNINKIKLVLVDGPICSGKTISSKKLASYLETYGVNPIIIKVKDYLKPKDDTVKKLPEGIKKIDVKLLNKHLGQLINGSSVKLPIYRNGKRDFETESITLKSDNIIILEGLYSFHDELTRSIKRENKYKIYVSPFTPIGIDRHNHLSTTDMRLIRKIVRSKLIYKENLQEIYLNKNEDDMVYPFVKEADAIINTAYPYEINILKVYAEPLLYNIDSKSDYYLESRRLLKILKAFFPVSSESILSDNILREFIGGNIYD